MLRLAMFFILARLQHVSLRRASEHRFGTKPVGRTDSETKSARIVQSY